MYLARAVDTPALRAELRLFGARPRALDEDDDENSGRPRSRDAIVVVAWHAAPPQPLQLANRSYDERSWFTVADLVLCVFAPFWPLDEYPLPTPLDDPTDYLLAYEADVAVVPFDSGGNVHQVRDGAASHAVARRH